MSEYLTPTKAQLAELVPLCMAKRLKDQAELGDLPAGKYRVQVTLPVGIDCFVTKGEESTYTPTPKLPLKAILAFALKKAGVDKEKMAKLIADAAIEAMKAGTKIADELEVTEVALRQVEEAILAKLPRSKRAGSVTVTGEVKIGQVAKAVA
jgi:hypothetical protein